MNIVEMWKKGKSRIEQGALYSDGTYFPVYNSSVSGYEVGAIERIAPYLVQEPDGWFYYSISSRHRIGNTVLVAGGGPYEGEGFVALLGENESPLWVLHLEGCEPLEIETCFENEAMVFGCNGYEKNSFIIPYANPEKFSYKQERM